MCAPGAVGARVAHICRNCNALTVKDGGRLARTPLRTDVLRGGLAHRLCMEGGDA